MKTRVSLKYPVNACWLALVSGKIKPPWPNAHSDKLIYVGSRSTRKCLLLNWVEFHLDIQKTICYKILNWCHYQSDHLKNTNPAADDRFTFHSFSYSKLASATIYSFTKIKLLKLWKILSDLVILLSALLWNFAQAFLTPKVFSGLFKKLLCTGFWHEGFWNENMLQ